MGIAISDTSVNQRKNKTVLYYDTKDNKAHCTHHGKENTLFGFELRWLHTINTN